MKFIKANEAKNDPSTKMKRLHPDIYQIWKEAFHETDDYIELFQREGAPLGEILTYGPEHAPYAALTLFPINLNLQDNLHPGYYLYALGTLSAQRGKGFGRQLVKEAEKYAIEHKKEFILLQPTDISLFGYYHHLDYKTPVYRASCECTRNMLHGKTALAAMETVLETLSGTSRNHFDWPPSLLEYVRKECLHRGGAIIDNAYCYPNEDSLGPFLEIKKFQSTAEHLPKLIEKILTSFPKLDRFIFYGKPQKETLPPSLQQAPFALLHFLNPELESKYIPLENSFALGLD